MGASVCSKNSRIWGDMMVSSGMLCKVVQANKDAFLVPDLRVTTPLLSTEYLGGGLSSVIIFDS